MQRAPPPQGVLTQRPEAPGTGCARLPSTCAVTLIGVSLIPQLTSLVEDGFNSSQADQGQPKDWTDGEGGSRGKL